MQDHIRNLVSSLCATGIAEVATLPICAIKTNYQTSSHGSIKNVISTIHDTRGIKGFYSASFPAIFSQMVSTSGKYTLYRVGTANQIPSVISAIGAGIIVSSFTHPLDFVRVTLQRGEKISNLSIKNDIRLFYRGYSKTLSKVIIGSSMFLPIYDFTKRNVSDNPLVSSMVSATISTTILQPLDYVKTRNIAGLPWYQGLNPLKYLRGCSLNLLRVVPHFMITMTLTEKIRTLCT